MNNCPLPVCPAWQGRERAVRTFTVLVRRRLLVSVSAIQNYLMTVPTSVSASVSAFSNFVLSTFGLTGVCVQTEYLRLSKSIQTISRQYSKSGFQTETGQAILEENPDRIHTADRIETDRIRTDRHRTENPDRFQTSDRHRTQFSGRSRQKRDKDRTWTVLTADVWHGDYGDK